MQSTSYGFTVHVATILRPKKKSSIKAPGSYSAIHPNEHTDDELPFSALNAPSNFLPHKSTSQ